MFQTYFAIPVLFSAAFLFGALIYVSMRRGDGSKSKPLVIIGLGIFLTLQISNFVIPTLIARASTSNFFVTYAIYAVSAHFMSMAGYSLLIAAAFAGRKPTVVDIPADFGGAGVSGDNPYSAPSM